MYNKKFLLEFKDYSETIKAELVYRKCLRAGKTSVANKIKQKYKLKDRNCDMIDAFTFALAMNF